MADRDDLVDDYLAAIERELSWLGEPLEVDTLFFGGGTPTHLHADQLRRLIELARSWFPLAVGYEFTIEANPADVGPALVEMLAEQGVTRISLGGQSFDAAKLRLLERDHAPDAVHRAVEIIRRHPFSLALDLIFAAPGETAEAWCADLEAAIGLCPDHVSTYGLTYEQGTTFWGRQRKGDLARLDEELERRMYAEAIDRLTAAGFEHYEVSNFALPGQRCRHNETYWSGDAYCAAGPGAARYIGGRREMNHRSTTTYLKRVLAGQSPVADTETLDPEDRAREALVFGLRRLEGVDRLAFERRTGFGVDHLAAAAIERFVGLGLLELEGNELRLTREGLFVSDSLWPHFLRR